MSSASAAWYGEGGGEAMKLDVQRVLDEVDVMLAPLGLHVDRERASVMEV